MNNRIIKFKFWSKILNRFVIPNDDIFVGALKDKNMVVCQFTGLLDKNGKEIYEGDIIKVSPKYFMDLWGVGDNTYKGAIWKDSELTGFNLGDIRKNIILRKDLAKKYFERIGNIYENPELLE